MAGDWLKWLKGLERKAEVLRMAAELKIPAPEVAGRLMVLWDWCDDNIADQHVDKDGHASVTLGAQALSLLDAISGVAGFAEAMRVAGWLKTRNDLIVFPNYSRHNGNTAKTRALASDRQRKKRHGTESKVSRSNRDKCVTREEKRRDISTNVDIWDDTKPKRFSVPTLEEVASYCKERGNEIDPQRFVDFYAAKDWMIGKNRMKDWKASVRTWEQNQPKKPTASDRIVTPEEGQRWNPITGLDG